MKIAINGLGRIGRAVLRAYAESRTDGRWADIEIAKINAPAAIENSLHLLKYDSVHGKFPVDIRAEDGCLCFGDCKIPVSHEREISKLDWSGIDVVLECTGRFNKRADAGLHIAQGAKKVLISAPSPDADATIVYGVNNDALKASDTVISIGSCTTNCLAPIAKALNDTIGIEHGFVTTIHSYTADQNIVDGSHKDLRRARAGGLSMVPTSTGAAKALGVVLPELQGKLDGVAIRVPTPNVSLVDLAFTAGSETSVEEIHSIIQGLADGAMSGVLATSGEPLVSIDFTGHSASSIFDKTQTYVVGGNFCRVASWYDNEWGFSCRMLDVAGLCR